MEILLVPVHFLIFRQLAKDKTGKNPAHWMRRRKIHRNGYSSIAPEARLAQVNTGKLLAAERFCVAVFATMIAMRPSACAGNAMPSHSSVRLSMTKRMVVPWTR